MVTIKEKSITTMRMAANCPTHARTDVSVRDLRSTIDEPTERGGTNMGMTPTETLMASLVGCTNVITQRIAHGMDVEIADMRIDASAKFDRRGVTLQAEVEVPFPEIDLTIRMRSTATPAQLDQIKSDLNKYCPIAKVIRGSGTRINETWEVTAG